MTEPREMPSRGDARRDSPARFLRELRQLRTQAGLDVAELAARAHYPYELIKAAEAGPELPDLPVLSAYVRGCGGTPADWEERWRAVTDSPASPLLTTRSGVWSEAADAGARVGAAAEPADGHDPERVMAALNRVADGMAASVWQPAPASSSVWDATPKSSPAPDPVWDQAPPVWDSAAIADPVWDAAPAADPVWDPAPPPPPAPARDQGAPAASRWDPASSAFDPAPQARSASYPAKAAEALGAGTAAPASAGPGSPTGPSRSAAASSASPTNAPADSQRRGLPSWRVYMAIITVALIVVATLLALST